MRFSVQYPFRWLVLITVSVACFSINKVYSNGSLSFGSNSARLSVGGGNVPLNLTFQGSVGLAGLQFRIISTSDAVRFTGIERGEVVTDVSAWALDYSITRAGDTITVVLWSRNRTSLVASNYNGVLSVVVSASNSKDPCSLILKDVHSVLANGLGSSGNVGIGSQASISIAIAENMQAYLGQNFPNPCNPSTLIRYTVPDAGHVTLKLYNALGQEVKTVINDFVASGEFDTVLWMDDLPSGMYFYRFSGTGFDHVRKLLLVK